MDKMNDDFTTDTDSNNNTMDIHVFFQGRSLALGRLTAEGIDEAIEGVVWDLGVGETDDDPMFVFADYDLISVYRYAHSNVGYNESSNEAQEFRVLNLFSSTGVLIHSVTFHRIREIEPGELEA